MSKPRKTQNLFAILLLILLLIAAMIGNFWQPYSVFEINIGNRFAFPSWRHVMGTDYLGRDILSLLLYGLGQSYLIAFIAIIPTAMLAVFLGFFAAGNNFIGRFITLFADFLFAFPAIITAIFFAAHLGAGRHIAIIAIALFALPIVIKVTRNQIFTLKSLSFIEASNALGITKFNLFFKHYLPNIRGPVLVQVAILFTVAILIEASLSYLGFGGTADKTSLGKMLFDAQRFSHIAPHTIIFPGLVIILIIVNINWLIDNYNQEKPIIELRF